MSPTATKTIVIGLAALVGGAVVATAQHHRHDATTGLGIPSSIQQEHEELHARLEHVTQTPGEVGAAAGEVARLLHTHFEAEERLAMPLLGLLRPLADHEAIADAEEARARARGLRESIAGMLEEHVRIKAALDELRAAAVHFGDLEAIAFADALMLHARNEEEVLYPAALLVGDVLETAAH